MMQKLKNLLYNLIVWSGIINHIGLVIFIVWERFLSRPKKYCKHEEADKSGHTLTLTRYNGRNYPIIAIDKLCSIPNVKIRNDDVLLCSYPKSGCHWLHEIMHMLVTGKIQMTKVGKEFAGGIDFLPDLFLDSLPSPRILNPHLLYRELPIGVREKKVKIVVLIRNPKDSVISFFHHHKGLKKYYGYDGDMSGYFDMFMEGRLEYGSYFDYILDWDKVLKTGTENPVLFITYEDLKKQPVEEVLKVAKFLKLNVAHTGTFLEEVIDACDFDKMKAVRSKLGKASSIMYRKGIVGDWRNWLTDAQSEAVDLMWEKRMMGCIYQPQY